MPHKVEIPKGSGRYYAYRKDETGKTTYVGKWADHLKEVKLEDYFRDLFTKSRPTETNVMVNTANMRFFKNENIPEEGIDLAINDLREITKQAVFQKFPEYDGLLDEIWVSDDPAFTEVQLKEDDEILASSYMKLQLPQTMITRLHKWRNNPDESIDAVMMRMGDERRGFEESVQKQAAIYYIKNRYEYPVELVEQDYVVRVPSDEEALDLEEDMKARGVSLGADLMYKGPMTPKKIRIEVGGGGE
jgi:hypothetical protein